MNALYINQLLKSLLISLMLLQACEQQTTISKKRKDIELKPSIAIHLQPFTDISPQLSNHVFNELRKIYPDVTLDKTIPLPASAFYAPRHRYRADSLIAFLGRNTKAGTVTIGMTSKDISTTKNGMNDWGVMGLGLQPGNACVISSFRLSKTDLRNQLFKVAIHELGHTQGLPHCRNLSCFMRDAEGKNPIDQETDFCPKCKAILKKKGWVFNP